MTLPSKRWPILIALAGLLGYGYSNYRIAGLENLRLTARQPLADVSPQFSDSDYSMSGYDAPPFSSEFSLDAMNASRSVAPPWSDQLSVGEKLAIWEGSQQSNASRSAGGAPSFPSGLSLPVSTPIPFTIPPPGLEYQAGKSQMAGPPMIGPDIAGPPIVGPPTSWLGNAASKPGMPATPKSAMVEGFRPDRIRVASFNLGGLGPAKLAKPHVVERLVQILRKFDVVALQEIRSSRDDILPILVERLNQSGRAYDYMIGPRVGRGTAHEQFAFIFDTSRVETDRFQLYTVDDPEDLMTFDPLVAWFRCKGTRDDLAFTFSVVNVRVDAERSASELAVLPNLITAVANDGRGEDDWLLLGDFAGSASDLPHLQTNAIRFCVRDIPTDVSGEQGHQLLMCSALGTTEFTGRSGAFDFLQKFNLSLENASDISPHLPIWAEFSNVEGLDPGRVAPLDPQSVY